MARGNRDPEGAVAAPANAPPAGRPRRRRALHHTLGAIVFASLVTALSCSQRPEEPVYESPFDPSGPDGGDPFRVTATYAANSVVVQWRRVVNDSLRTYVLERAATPAGAWVHVSDVAVPTSGSSVTYTDNGYARGRDNYYRVLGRTPGGEITATSLVTLAHVYAPPGVRIVETADSARSRFQLVHVWAQSGDSVFATTTPDLVPQFAAKRDTVTLFKLVLDAGNMHVNGDKILARAWVRAGGGRSLVARDSTLVRFDPRAYRLTDPVVANPVRLAFWTAGVDSFRLALRRADLAGSAWRAPGAGDTMHVAANLVEGLASPQAILLETASDFGFQRVDSIAADPAIVAPVCDGEGTCFTIEGGAAETARSIVRLTMAMRNATRMRFSEATPLDGVPWITYADTCSFALSPGAGTKTIHGQFVNSFDAAGQAASASINRVTAAARRSGG